PTVASTTDQTPNTGQTAGSRPPTTAPTKPSKKSSIFWPQPDPPLTTRHQRPPTPKRNPTPSRHIGPLLLHENSQDSDLLKSAVELDLDIAPNSIVGVRSSGRSLTPPLTTRHQRPPTPKRNPTPSRHIAPLLLHEKSQ